MIAQNQRVETKVMSSRRAFTYSSTSPAVSCEGGACRASSQKRTWACTADKITRSGGEHV